MFPIEISRWQRYLKRHIKEIFHKLMIMQEGIISIDGSYGEGGGQILRTALLLSLATGKPFEITNIRSKRPKPGLLNQHLAAVRAFRKVTSSTVIGDELGSTKLRFFPGKVTADKVAIDVGTAGSVTLILSSILPALSIIGAEMTIDIKGGTDTKWSPAYDYFSNVIIPLYQKLGINVQSRLLRRGFYPVGGGEVVATSQGCKKVLSLKSKEGTAKQARIRSICSNLPLEVAGRQTESARKLLQSHEIEVVDIETKQEPAASPGTAITIWHVDIPAGIFVGGDAVGERGIAAEEIGRRAATSFTNSSRAPLDAHIADVAIPLLSLAEGDSEIAFPEVTGHIRSNIYTASLFTKRRFELSKPAGLDMLRIS
jgi:RNA 3'-phosphate cyclase